VERTTTTSRETAKHARTFKSPATPPAPGSRRTREPKRQRDQLVDPVRHPLEDEALEDRHVAREQALVRRQVLRVEEVDARRVDPDEPDSRRVKAIDERGSSAAKSS